MKTTLKIEGTSLSMHDDQNNKLYGFITETGIYKIVGAIFNDKSYTKEQIRWKKDGRGAVSKAFYEWVQPMTDTLYREYFKNKV